MTLCRPCSAASTWQTPHPTSLFHVGSEGASRDVLNWSSIAPNLHPRPQGASTISSPSFGPSRTSVLRGPATDMPARHATNRQGSSQNRSKPFWTLEKQVWLCDWAAQKVALSLDTGGKDKSNPLSTQCSQPQVETGESAQALGTTIVPLVNHPGQTRYQLHAWKQAARTMHANGRSCAAQSVQASWYKHTCVGVWWWCHRHLQFCGPSKGSIDLYFYNNVKMIWSKWQKDTYNNERGKTKDITITML